MFTLYTKENGSFIEYYIETIDPVWREQKEEIENHAYQHIIDKFLSISEDNDNIYIITDCIPIWRKKDDKYKLKITAIFGNTNINKEMFDKNKQEYSIKEVFKLMEKFEQKFYIKIKNNDYKYDPTVFACEVSIINSN